MINNFLKHHRVDVCRSLAVLGFAGAISDVVAMIVQPAFTGAVALNFGPIISLFLAAALWGRECWVRKLLIGFGWLAAFCIVGATIKVVFFGDMELTAYGVRVTKPSSWQYFSILFVSAPVVYALLRVFHSEKFREEVESASENGIESNQPPEPTSPSQGGSA